VTPSSKVVGDLALYLCGVNADPAEFERNPGAFDIPESVIGFLEGELGTPPGGWPEPFRTKALAGRRPTPHVEALTPEDEAALQRPSEVRATLNRLLFPGPTSSFESSLRTFGDLSTVPTGPFFYGLVHGEETEVSIGPGVSLFLTIDAVGELDDAGYRIAYCRLNGQYRALNIRDRSAEDRSPHREKALANDATQVGAPFAGVVITRVAAGDTVSVGQTVATIEAMKMEAAITAGIAGIVGRVAVESVANVEGGDLLLTISPREE
jgi:pyruvate carboxylase